MRWDESTTEVNALLSRSSLLCPTQDSDHNAEILRLRPALFGERPELFQPIIDEFYMKVIGIRDSIGLASSVTERNEAIASIRALQNLGFELVVSEKLAADDSFRIFIELSNRAIDDLTGMLSQ
jgi:hypothetical protein